jgi:DNA-binding beta-propeller fold protein YncE
MITSDARTDRSHDVLAVVSQSGPTVTFFNAATDQALGAIELLAEPHELCFDPSQRLLWCTNSYYSGYYHANAGRRTQVTIIDPESRRVVDVIDLTPEHGPHGLALDAARNRLYVSVEGSDDRRGGVVVIDTLARKPLGRIDTGAFGPHWFVIDPVHQRGYAANKEAPFVSVVDLDAETMTATVAVPGSEGLAISDDGAELYVAGPYAVMTPASTVPGEPSGIRVIDTQAGAVVDVLVTENTVIPVHLTATGTLLAGESQMVVDGSAGLGTQGPGKLTAFSTATRKAVAGVALTGHLPLTITASPDGRLGYVASVASSTVDIVDLHTWKGIASLKIDKAGEPGAHGMAYIPRP